MLIHAAMSAPLQTKRLYAVEFLRIWLILCVIFSHIIKISPDFKILLIDTLHSSGLRLHEYSVSFFFMIGGFFLYRNLARNENSAYSMIKKTYFRLMPGLAFAFTICLIIGFTKWMHAPIVLSLFGGTSLAPVVVRGGEWFIGTYFWVTCLYIGIFKISPKNGWLWLGILMYLVLELRLYAPITNKEKYVQSTYYTIIGKDFIRGIIGMGWGMIAGFFADRIRLSTTWPIKTLFTIIEAICLINLYNALLNTKSFHLTVIEMELLGIIFMISVANSWGYISTLLNRMSFIQLFSRYTYSVLIGHIVCLRTLEKYNNFDMGDYSRALFVIGGGIVLGVIEYHLIEKWFVPKIKNYIIS